MNALRLHHTTVLDNFCRPARLCQIDFKAELGGGGRECFHLHLERCTMRPLVLEAWLPKERWLVISSRLMFSGMVLAWSGALAGAGQTLFQGC